MINKMNYYELGSLTALQTLRIKTAFLSPEQQELAWQAGRHGWGTKRGIKPREAFYNSLGLAPEQANQLAQPVKQRGQGVWQRAADTGGDMAHSIGQGAWKWGKRGLIGAGVLGLGALGVAAAMAPKRQEQPSATY